MDRLMVLGGTGLVGQAVLALALADGRVGRIIAPTRRPLPPHPKLDNPIVADFDQLDPGADAWRVDAVVCALGTTIRTTGSQDAFRKVDFDYPLAFARLTRRHGAAVFALTSASGANADSRVFYSRTKGELERALQACGFPSLTLVRPGLLGGERAEKRRLERTALQMMGVLEPLLPKRYRIVPAAAVAHALLEAAIAARPGVHVIESEAIPR